jgi:multiple RNA-binding domain-containing protein 1
LKNTPTSKVLLQFHSSHQSTFTSVLQIAENVARQYGMSKSEFLDPGAEDLAVRMALGETHIIAETKRSLSDEGVDVEVLEEVASGRMGKVNRSKSVILVKNLPFTTSEADLVSMFGVFGTLGHVILPPTKTLALVSLCISAYQLKCKNLCQSLFCL